MRNLDMVTSTITFRHGIYQFRHVLSNDLRARILENYEIAWKCVNPIEWKPYAQPPCQMNILEMLVKNS